MRSYLRIAYRQRLDQKSTTFAMLTDIAEGFRS